MRIAVPFPLDNPDACRDINDGLTCPLHKDQEYTYSISLFVQKRYPPVTSIFKFYIYSFLYLYLLFRNLDLIYIYLNLIYIYFF